jgi:hypothetical protein
LVEEECKADLARAKWALDGGLKDESRMNRVFGDGGLVAEGLILRTMRNLESDDWKDLRAASSCGRMLRSELVVVLMMQLSVQFLRSPYTSTAKKFLSNIADAVF